MSLRFPEMMTSVLEEGRQAYVAVASKDGPHVTPELYSWSGDALWFASASTTLKAKVLRREPAAGVLVHVGGRSVILTGDTVAFDPRRPFGLLSRSRDLPALAGAMTRFTVRNAADLGAFAGDAATGRLGARVPPLRVMFRMEPARAVLVENDAVTGSWGTWDGAGSDGHGDVPPIGGQVAVLALPGPVALPARWFPEQQRAHVLPVLLRLVAAAGDVDLGLATDSYRAPGPAAKRGMLRRGRGRVLPDGSGWLEIDPQRLVEWDGVTTSSTDV